MQPNEARSKYCSPRSPPLARLFSQCFYKTSPRPSESTIKPDNATREAKPSIRFELIKIAFLIDPFWRGTNNVSLVKGGHVSRDQVSVIMPTRLFQYTRRSENRPQSGSSQLECPTPRPRAAPTIPDYLSRTQEQSIAARLANFLVRSNSWY